MTGFYMECNTGVKCVKIVGKIFHWGKIIASTLKLLIACLEDMKEGISNLLEFSVLWLI